MRQLIRYTCAIICLSTSSFAEDPLFSGPQVGEKLPPFNVNGILGDQAGKTFDLIAAADGQPVFIVFFHQRTRPAFGLSNALMKYAASRKADGLISGVVFLTDDATATENWLNIVQKNLSTGVEIAISPDGQEGPGAYGLNRNVTLTVLIGNKGRVTANFALIQPSVQADGPKILKALTDVIGGEVPDLAELAGERYAAMRRPEQPATEDDPNMRPLMRAVIDKQATPEQVAAAAKNVEEYVAEHPAAAKQLGRIANTIVKSGKLANYGTEAAQQQLKDWAKKYGANDRLDQKTGPETQGQNSSSPMP